MDKQVILGTVAGVETGATTGAAPNLKPKTSKQKPRVLMPAIILQSRQLTFF